MIAEAIEKIRDMAPAKDGRASHITITDVAGQEEPAPSEEEPASV